MNIKEINFNKIKNLIQQILNILAKKSSLFFLFLIIFHLILGGILIYKYSVLAQRTEILDIEIKQNTIKKNAYQEILEHWENKKIKFNEISEIIYPDPFIEKIEEQPAENKEDSSSDLPADVSTQALAKEEASEETKEGLSSEAPTEAKGESTTKSFFGKINTLFDYYMSQRENFLSIDERAKIWGQEGLGETGEYQGFYNQNIKLLEQLTK